MNVISTAETSPTANPTAALISVQARLLQNRHFTQIAASAIFLSDYNTMTSADVIDIYSTLGGLGIQIWIDGGWGVDALLGRQTRPHKDLDIALEDQHLVRFERFLALRGYHRVKREIERPFNFVLADHSGREIDVHVISLDENGDGIYGPPENCLTYPAESLTGIGTISGCTVRCISPQWMVKFHSGYELTEKDYKDVSAICEKYGMKLPDEYSRFTRQH